MSTASPPPAETRQAGAEVLAERLYTAHRARLLAIARRNCANADDAEEALQDAFVLFIDHFDPEGEAPPLPWLTLTLKRRCWALYKQRHVRLRSARAAIRRAGPKAHGGNRPPEELCEVSEEVAKLRRALLALKPDERHALGLLALGYTYREICELTGWSHTKVNRCLNEGRTRLRELAR